MPLSMVIQSPILAMQVEGLPGAEDQEWRKRGGGAVVTGRLCLLCNTLFGHWVRLQLNHVCLFQECFSYSVSDHQTLHV